MVDDHVKGGKMIVESAQMLANTYSREQLSHSSCPRTQTGNIRKYSYYNHPSSIWVRQSIDHFQWLVIHALGMGQERKFRTGEGHFSLDFVRWCVYNGPDLPKNGFVDPPLCMPDNCKVGDAVISYRAYYCLEKRHLWQWTNRPIPEWIIL